MIRLRVSSGFLPSGGVLSHLSHPSKRRLSSVEELTQCPKHALI